MLQKLGAKGKTVTILACSGGSNLGQLTNRAALELTQEGLGNMSCLAGVGAGLEKFINTAREASSLVILDGCPIGCAKAIVTKAGLPLDGYVEIQSVLGIEKNKDFNLQREHLDQVKARARQAAGAAS